ncbi:MAG: HIT family protein [Actinobacteria bacterium]|nr:HIT family protein [Actinomycetota bacterium]MCB8997966.1 HIT family protein [Actinomycetota bacterium]MCB9414437.1 HIT family protein [Actinomycetota bacterium]MCB9424722.1 HIT family protein [Actinomycetota bacterium]HRY08697.1 HIT family protein [Candidatus Nanopelagicales bacterium]
MTCIFCAIVAGDLPATVIAETDHTLAFMDINPATRGHALVIPKKHAADLMEIDEDDLARCTALAKQIARRAIDRLDADGVNLVNACGSAAWQTVFHFHIHVVPRYEGNDGLELPWIPTPGDPEVIAQAAAELR